MPAALVRLFNITILIVSYGSLLQAWVLSGHLAGEVRDANPRSVHTRVILGVLGLTCIAANIRLARFPFDNPLSNTEAANHFYSLLHGLMALLGVFAVLVAFFGFRGRLFAFGRLDAGTRDRAR
jgi:hypothetical protein